MRRIVVAGLVAATVGAAAAAVPSDDRTIVHVLNRIGYGARPGDVERVRRLGVERYIDEQLRPDRINDSALTAKLAGLSTIGMSSREIADRFERPAVEARKAKKQGDDPPTPEERAVQQKANSVVVELSEQKLLRAIYSERQLQEVLTDFWFNHFNVDARKGADKLPADRVRARRDPAARPRQVPRSARGDGEESGDAVLSRQLDERRSERPARGDAAAARRARSVRRCAPVPQPPRMPAQGKNAPKGLNENYGRELMELHTLGVDGGYTQHDVTEVARAFTGWTIQQAARRAAASRSTRGSTTSGRRSCSAT